MPTSYWCISLSLVHMKGEKTQTNKQQQKNLRDTCSTCSCHLLSLQWWQTGNQLVLPAQANPTTKSHGSVHTPPACPMNSMALLEPSCSPGNGLPSQQCGNSLLKQKDIALLGVIKPIKKSPRAYLCLVKSHDWDFVERCESDTWKAWVAISSTSQWETPVCCSCLYLSSQSDECFGFANLVPHFEVPEALQTILTMIQN